jgi:RNA processing factor Prp31
MSRKAKRNIHCSFKATEEEMDIIRQKMKVFGITNQSAFIRAMTLNGYVLKLDLPELHQAVRLMGSMSNNINQIARRMHERGSVYETEIDEIKANHDELRAMLNEILQRLDQLNK